MKKTQKFYLFFLLILLLVAAFTYAFNYRSSTTALPMADLKSYIITLKETASDTDVSALQSKVKELGGEIGSQFSLIKGFTAKLPSIHTSTIEGHENVLAIEEDKEVKVQPI